jgi:oxalate decarboxylase/phosphoglucose isomerase-like protein (cupin superfamily)
MGVFGSSGQARTFDFRAGDVGYVPFAMGHYVENTGSQPLRFLEMFKSSYYADVSLDQWIALTPARTGVGAPANRPPDDRRAAKREDTDRAGVALHGVVMYSGAEAPGSQGARNTMDLE